MVEHKEFVTMLAKILLSILGTAVSVRVFVTIMYNISVKYVENIRKQNEREMNFLRDDIQDLYGKFSNSENGIEHRITRIETLCGVCFKRKGKK